MSVARMDKLLLLGMRKDQTAIVAALTKLGAVAIEEDEALKEAYLRAMRETPDGEAPPTLEDVDRAAPAPSVLNGPDSPLRRGGTAVPSEAASGSELADWGRGEGTSSMGAGSATARFYFYDMMRQLATIDDKAPGDGHEFEMQSRTRKLMESLMDPEELAKEAYRANAEAIDPEEIPQLRGLCQSHQRWFDALIPQAMRLSGEKKPMFTVKRSVDTSAYSDAGLRQAEIIEAAAGLEQVIGDIERIEKEMEQLEATMQVIKPWRKLQVPRTFRMRGRDPYADRDVDWGIRTMTGSFPTRESLDDMRETVAEEGLPIAVEALGYSENESVAAVVAYLVQDERHVRELMDEAHFAELPRLAGIQVSTGDYREAWEKQRERMARLEAQLENAKERGKELAAYKEDLEVLHDFYQVQDKKLEAMERFLQTDHIFVLTGYIPQALAETVSKALSDRYHTVIEIAEVEEDEDYPIILQNPKFVRPFESVIRTFSMPKPGFDADPTAAMAPFYVILFGMMLGDIGYGLLLAILCGVLLWKVKVQGNFRDMTVVLFMSGIVSIPMGLLFGSFFGNAVSTVTDGRFEMPALLLNPLEEPINMLLFSMVVGLLHLFAGMAVDIRVKWALGQRQEALFGVAPWYLIMTSIPFLVLGHAWAKYTVIVGVAIILLLSTPVKNPFKRIFGGLGNLYDVTGWLSDLLSYARVLALALATSVIAMVVNMLAMIPGWKGLGIIGFIPIMIFGHVLNLALSGLSAYVHTTRLQYVEFFGKFYEGGGRPFAPLNYETRYTRASRTEDQQEHITRGQFPRIPARFAKGKTTDT